MMMKTRWPMATWITRSQAILATLLLAWGGHATAATYTVTTLGDGVGSCTAAGANFNCSTLRAAITASNLTTTVDDTIVFSVAGTINVGSAMNVTDTLVLNGGNTITLDGGGAAITALSFSGAGASNSELRNTRFTGFNQNIVIFGPNMAGGRIEGNTLNHPTATTDPIRVNTSTGVTVANNTITGGFYGISVFNTALVANNNHTVAGNTVTGSISGIGLFSANGVTVDNNTILNSTSGGIRIGFQVAALGSSNNTIRNNSIRNNLGPGINVTPPSNTAASYNNNRIIDNTITGNGGDGIMLTSYAGNGQINDNVVTGNVIRGNGGAGVGIIGGNARNNAIYANTDISANGGLGIDLVGTAGVTANDAGDADTGPNALQNFPVVTSVVGTTVNFLLDAQANANGYRIDFYDNPGGVDPTGHGEGQVWLSSCIVGSPSATSVSSCTVPGVNAATLRTTATRCQSAGCASTATTSIGETSEFSGPTLGTIVIVKDAVPNDAQDFAFTTTGAGLSGFSLDDDADGTLSNTRTFLALSPGSYSVTEGLTAGWNLTGLTCVDPDNGSTVNVGTRTASIDLDGGETVTCSFTNNLSPRVTLRKISLGGVGTFAFSGSNGVAAHDITTTVAGTAVNGAVQVLTAANTATTLTEGAPPAGYALTGIACTGLPGGGTATPNLATRTVTLNSAATAPGADVTCTFTNTRLPQITIAKVSQGGSGTFAFSGSNGVATQNITTVAEGVAVSGVPQTLTAANTITTLTEATLPAGYDLTGIACSGVPGGGSATPNLATRTVTLDAAATAPGAAITCTFTNTRQAVIRLQKTLPQGRRGSSDQFALSMTGPGAPATITTSGTGGTATGVLVHAAASVGATYTLSEAAAGTTVLSRYVPRWQCANARAGGQAPSGTGSSFSITPASGDDLTCTFVNDRAPVLVLDKYLPLGRQAAGDQFTLSASGPGAPVSVTTSGTDNTPTQSLTIEATAGATYTLSEAAAGTATLANYRTGYACTNVLAGGQEPAGFGSSFSVVLAAGDDVHCSFVNEPLPRLTLRALSQGGTGSFTFSGSNGFDAETLVTTAAGVAVSGATQTLDAFNSTTTVTAGTTPVGFTLSGIACTGLPSGGTATPDLAARTLVLNAAATAPAANVVCTFSYRRLAADVAVSKTASAATVLSGDNVTFSLVVRNNGPDAADSAVLRDDWTIQPGLDCSAGPLTCAESGTGGTQCPAPAGVTPAALQSGLTIPALPNGGIVTLTLVCRVTATGW